MKIQLSKTQWEHIGRTAGWLQRKASMTATVKYEITYLGDPWDAMVNIVVTKVGNNGIGPYEFWGSRGFDKGSNFVEGFEIEDIEIPGLDLPEEEKLMIIETKAFLVHVKKLICLKLCLNWAMSRQHFADMIMITIMEDSSMALNLYLEGKLDMEDMDLLISKEERGSLN